MASLIHPASRIPGRSLDQHRSHTGSDLDRLTIFTNATLVHYDQPGPFQPSLSSSSRSFSGSIHRTVTGLASDRLARLSLARRYRAVLRSRRFFFDIELSPLPDRLRLRRRWFGGKARPPRLAVNPAAAARPSKRSGEGGQRDRPCYGVGAELSRTGFLRGAMSGANRRPPLLLDTLNRALPKGSAPHPLPVSHWLRFLPGINRGLDAVHRAFGPSPTRLAQERSTTWAPRVSATGLG